MMRSLSRQDTIELVNHIYAKEQQAIKMHRYRNERTRAEDLRSSRESYDISHQLLSSIPNKMNENTSDARTMAWEAARSSVRFGYEAIINLRLRKHYIGANFQIANLIESSLRELPAKGGQAALESWASRHIENLQYKFYQWSDASSKTWRLSWYRNPGWETLLQQETEKLQYLRINTGANPALAEGELVQVYENAFRQLAVQHEYTLALLRGLGAAVSVLTTGIMLWFILQDTDPWKATAKTAVSIPSSIAMGYAGTQIGLWVGMLAGPVGSMIGGIFGGLIGSFAGGLASDFLFETVVHAFSTEIPDRLKLKMFGTPIRYELTLPNTMQLSRDFIAKLR